MKTNIVLFELEDAELAALLHFFGQIHYGTVYSLTKSRGDGNKKGSASDVETRQTLDALMVVRRALQNADHS